MFATLKNKIKEETGSDVTTNASTGMTTTQQRFINNNNNRMRSRFSSTMSVNSNIDGCESVAETEQMCHLRSQCNELSTKVANLTASLTQLQQEKMRVDKTNEILLESVKVAQTQKDLYCEEQEKIQNLQQNEIDKLKNLLSFREQEAVDRLSGIRQKEHHIEHITHELERLRPLEPIVEDLRDELQRLQHASQLDKNQLTTTLAAVNEENRHMKMRLQIVEEARLNVLTTLNAEEQVKALVQERKLLEQHLEEAHLQLSDIKSSWSGQNLALETQVSRLSKQVAEETTEKRKALKARDDANEKVKQLEFELHKLQDELKQRNDKIKLLEEEIDELNSALRECREENEQQILFERNKSETLEIETKDLKARIESAEERFTDYAANAEQVAQKLREQNAQQQQHLNETQSELENEREEKLTALLRNAEISQSEELLKKELRNERNEMNELNEQIKTLATELKAREKEVVDGQNTLEELKELTQKNEEKIRGFEEVQQQLSEKNKTIKMLNQRLADLKKTLQKEFRQTTEGGGSSGGGGGIEQWQQIINNTGAMTMMMSDKQQISYCSCGLSTGKGQLSGNIVMDEINFKYLKHVIVKFLTSREVEARHLIRAVATLLQLTTEEEKLLHDTLNWKMSWFGSKPNHGSGQHAFSIPPS